MQFVVFFYHLYSITSDVQARVSYLDFLLAKNTLTDDQLIMLVLESIIEAADTTLVTTEWVMYELAKHPEKQVSTET